MARGYLTIARAVLVFLSILSSPRSEAQGEPPVCDAGSKIAIDAASSVCGVEARRPGVYAYKGIEYAKAGRWKAPAPAQWPPGRALEAVQFGPVCPQENPPQPMAEDCLYLNVWTPRDAIRGAKSLPVMVFIHGGAFVKGSGSLPLYDGSALAERGAVVVTMNYRLGALGFLTANAPGSAAIEGNFGLLDQQAAMTWVARSIAAFGGDPHRVTLFGESAGAMSVGLHTFDMPTSGPLFAAAIMQSNPLGLIYLTAPQAEGRGAAFLQALCEADNASAGAKRCPDDLAWLTEATVADILKSQSEASGRLERALGISDLRLSALLDRILEAQALPWAPVVDGKLVVGEPYDGYAPQAQIRKPLVFGINANEGALFVAQAYAKKPEDFTPRAYRGFLALRFGRRIWPILRTPRYAVNAQVSTPYYSAAGAAYANLMTDYVFACGALSAADAAIKQSSQPVFGYRFTQPPFTDLYLLSGGSDNGACAPQRTQPNVCHGNDLPYVFDTLDAVTTANYRPRPADRSLAEAMNAAWFAFAQNPSAPGEPWIGYDGRGRALSWKGDGNGIADLDKLANCRSLWLQALPYSGGLVVSGP